MRIDDMDWFSMLAGEGCPFDRPRIEPNDYWDSVAVLEVSTLCLLRNQFYRGHSILIYDPKHVARLDQLTSDEWARFARDAHAAAGVLVAVCVHTGRLSPGAAWWVAAGVAALVLMLVRRPVTPVFRPRQRVASASPQVTAQLRVRSG